MRTKVLVIGGGPAGATAAGVLSRAGVETVLIEKNLSYVKPCGGAIPSGALKELEIPERLVKKKIKKIKLFSPSGQSVEADLKAGFIAIVNRGGSIQPSGPRQTGPAQRSSKTGLKSSSVRAKRLHQK